MLPFVFEADGTTIATSLQFSYQWYRGGAALKGRTGQAYVLQPADVGKKITVKVTVRAPGRR